MFGPAFEIVEVVVGMLGDQLVNGGLVSAIVPLELHTTNNFFSHHLNNVVANPELVDTWYTTQ